MAVDLAAYEIELIPIHVMFLGLMSNIFQTEIKAAAGETVETSKLHLESIRLDFLPAELLQQNTPTSPASRRSVSSLFVTFNEFSQLLVS